MINLCHYNLFQLIVRNNIYTYIIQDLRLVMQKKETYEILLVWINEIKIKRKEKKFN